MGQDGLRILTLRDKEAWRECLERMPERERAVYYLPEYYALYETAHSTAECAVYGRGDGLLVYPYLRTYLNTVLDVPLKQDSYDLEGAPGFNGMLSTSWEPSFLKGFSRAFTDYCGDSGVVAEFTRFHPGHGAERFRGLHLDAVEAGRKICLDLTPPLEEIVARSYDRSRRKNLRKAGRGGLTTRCVPGPEMDPVLLDRFIDLYYVTMVRKGADHRHFYEDRHFTRACGLLGGRTLFFFVFLGDRPVAAELVLVEGKQAVSWLGGDLTDYYAWRPNDLLKHAIVSELKERGVEHLCLGGGVKGEDGVFRFKRNFAKDGVRPFFVGTKVHARRAYEQLCRAAGTSSADAQERGEMLLRYRY